MKNFGLVFLCVGALGIGLFASGCVTGGEDDAKEFSLVIKKTGAGAGTVTTTDGEIACGADCEATYVEGDTVTLAATADSNSTFVRWSGACTGTEPTCAVTLDQAREVVAEFATKTQPLAPSFKLKSPDVTIAAGEELVTCYYFHTPNTAELAVKNWTSHLGAAATGVTVVLTATDLQPEGTQSPSNCSAVGSGSNFPEWLYHARTTDASFTFPADDGAGKPVGQRIAAGHSGFIEIHYLNPTDAPITSHVEVEATGYAIGTQITQAGTFVTYNNSLSIPPSSTGQTAIQSCNVPTGAQFFAMTTETHKQSIHTSLKDGSVLLFESTDWENPGVQAWSSAPYYSFTSGKLTYECTYNNPTGRTIRTGDSQQTDEMCMAITYFFPATRSRFCIDNILLP